MAHACLLTGTSTGCIGVSERAHTMENTSTRASTRTTDWRLAPGTGALAGREHLRSAPAPREKLVNENTTKKGAKKTRKRRRAAFL